MCKRGSFLIFLVLFLFVSLSAYAKEDPMSLLSGDFVGVGSVNMERFTKRALYDDVMKLVLTDARAADTLKRIESQGFDIKKDISRIVVGVPADVERREHIIIWESKKELSKLESVFEGDGIEKREHNGMSYFAYTRDNICVAILGKMMVQGSELKVKSVLDTKKAGKAEQPISKSSLLNSQVKAADTKKDAWFAFVVPSRIQKRLAADDPILSDPVTGAALRLSEVKAGRVAIDFASGLTADSVISVVSKESAASDAQMLDLTLKQAAEMEELKAMQLTPVINGVKVSSKDSNLKVSLKLSQSEFDTVKSLVTNLAQGAPMALPASAPKSAAPKKAESPAAEPVPVAAPQN